MLDNKLEMLGVNFQRQYDLIKGVLDSNKKKMNKVNIEDISDKKIMEMLISKLTRIFLE